MAKDDLKDKENQEQSTPEVLEDTLSKTEVVLEENKDLITKVVIGVAIVIVGIFFYNNMVAEPAEIEASQDIWPIEKVFASANYDSAATEFEYIAEEHAGTDAGNLANYYLGVSELKSGNYDAALTALENFDASGKLLPGLKVGLIGDCYSELGQVEDAVANYKKAASLLNSKSVSPYYLKKAGILLEQNGQATEAVEVYQTALNDYLSSVAPSAQAVKKEIEKLLVRAQTAK